MSLFDSLVQEALSNQPQLSSLKLVVEKELLHHDILRIMSEHDLLLDLTFIGGTCLRTCYGSVRLSEDLDFTGGKHFTRKHLTEMGDILSTALHEKYDLPVNVQSPVKDKQNVDTWKIKIETKPKQKHLPTQRINIDICVTPSYEVEPKLLLNPYLVDMGTTGLILNAESRAEIYADKLLAFALRPNRVKHRDLWDMLWLHQQSIQPQLSLVKCKLADRNLTHATFLKHFQERLETLKNEAALETAFRQEMQRFLPLSERKTLEKSTTLWGLLCSHLSALFEQMKYLLSDT